MRHLKAVLAVSFMGALAALTAGAKDYSYADLLRKMVDLQGLAVLPEAGEKCFQFSSYDRASKSADDPKGWNANGDYGQYLRKDGEESVMADVDGPGCVVRIWSANPAGTLKIYIDGASTPSVAAPTKNITIQSWQNADRIAVPAGTQEAWVFPEPIGTGAVSSAFCGRRAAGWNLYFPIPFQKHLKVTVSGAPKPQSIYYHVNIQSYPAGTKLPSWSPDLVTQHEKLVKEVFDELAAPEKSVPSYAGESQSFTLGAGDAFDERIPGPAAITFATAKVTAADLRKALRDVVVKITFDDAPAPQVWAPLGDFFGSMPGYNLYASLPMGMTKERMYCRWYMPFKESAKIEVVNEGTQQVTLLGSAVIEPISWNDRLGYFHAKWRRTPKNTTFDWPFIEAQGRGRVVGVAMGIFNPIRDWWGEGDEKVWVDGEAFPSTFGTGSEDYFGYAWCNTALFQHAYHNQTLCEGPRNGNNSSVNRWHIADNLPFMKSIRFAIEDWPLGNKIGKDYCCTTYWYATADTRDFFAPVPAADRAPRMATKPFRIPGVLEGEELQVVEGRDAEPQSMDGFKGQWSNGAQLWWKPAAAGAKLALAFESKFEGDIRISAFLTKSWDYGTFRFTINGKEAAARFDAYSGKPKLCMPTGPVELGVFPIKEGRNVLTVEVVGTHKDSGGYYFGLDGLFIGR